MISECKLDVNRHDEGIIFSRFHGNDIKRLCKSTESLASELFQNIKNPMILVVSNSLNYQRIIHALRVFDVWCRLVSTTETGLSDERVQAICCRGVHAFGLDCCQTAKLGQVLEDLGGFGGSGLVHVMIMHLGPFVWKHRMVGALAEEGIEGVHCKLATETLRHKKQANEKIKNALKWLAIDVLLNDRNKFTLK